MATTARATAAGRIREASEAVAGARAGEHDVTDESRRRAQLVRDLAETRGSERTLGRLSRAADFDARLADADARLTSRGFSLALLDETPDGYRLLFAERAASLVESLDLHGAAEPLDGCLGRCAECPQRAWCDFGREVTR